MDIYKTNSTQTTTQRAMEQSMTLKGWPNRMRSDAAGWAGTRYSGGLRSMSSDRTQTLKAFSVPS